MAFMTASQLSQQYQSVLKPANKPEHEVSQVTSTDDKYEVKLSINQFEPEELSVKVVDRYIHIEGRHEEKNDKIGFFTRQFTRRYFLPEGVQPEAIRCTFSVETSILTVNAPIINKKPVKELVIPIIVVDQQPVYSQPNKERKDRDKDKYQHQKEKLDRQLEKLDKHLQQQQQQHDHHHHHHHQSKQQPSTLPQQKVSHKSSVSTTSTYPPPAIASTSASSRRHHHNHHHHQEKQVHQQHHHHHHHLQDYPASQMNF